MRIFMLRSKPHNVERIDIFLEKNLVAIGWSDTGDLTGASKEDIRNSLKSLGYEGQSLLTNLGMVNSFINTMREGDLVLVREGEIVHVGKVGKYMWNDEYLDKHMAHTRSTEWLAHVPFNELNAEIQSLLKNIRTICKFKGDLEQSGLGRYLADEGSIIADLTINDKQRESLLANTFDVLKELMNSAEDETVRLEAAKELLKYLNK